MGQIHAAALARLRRIGQRYSTEVRDNVSVTDLAAINTPDLHKVHLIAEVTSTSKQYNGPVHFRRSAGHPVIRVEPAGIQTKDCRQARPKPYSRRCLVR